MSMSYVFSLEHESVLWKHTTGRPLRLVWVETETHVLPTVCFCVWVRALFFFLLFFLILTVPTVSSRKFWKSDSKTSRKACDLLNSSSMIWKVERRISACSLLSCVISRRFACSIYRSDVLQNETRNIFIYMWHDKFPTFPQWPWKVAMPEEGTGKYIH